MVKIELVSDEVNVEPAVDPRAVEKAEAVSDSDDWINDEDDEDDFDVNESFAERLSALKDIVPPKYRAQLGSTFGSASALAQRVAEFGGKSVWVLTSSTLLLGVPLALCILSEQQLSEMEKSMGMGMGESDNVLAYGGEPEQAAPATATA